MTCGIYLISCHGRPYVGQSIAIEDRWKTHIRLMKRGKHRNYFLQGVYSKHGLAKFQFSILEECSPDVLTVREHYWCEALSSYRHGCNIAPAGDSPTTGRGHTPETKAKLSKLRLGTTDVKRQFTPEQVIDIWLCYMDGESALSIALRHNVDSKIIWNIVRRRYYKEIELPPSCRRKEHRRKGGGRKRNDIRKQSTELFREAGVTISVAEGPAE